MNYAMLLARTRRTAVATGVEPPVSGVGWDISTAVFSQSFSVETPAAPRYSNGVFFRADGLKMYIIGDNNSLSEEYIDEYTLGSAWDITTATRVQNLNVFAQEAAAFGVFFKPDGMKLYFVGIGGDAVNEYSLGTAWDISTASFSQDFDLSSQTAGPTGIFFKPDGLGMYIAAFTTDEVHQYALASPWNIGTATHSQSVSVQAQAPVSVDLFFKPDGLKMYVVGTENDIVSEYNLGTAWDIATATFLQSFSFAADGLDPRGVFFKPDGLKMFVVSSDNLVYEYSLG